MPAAAFCQPRIYRPEVFMQQSVKTSRPGFLYALAAQPRNQRLRFIERQPTARPASERNIRIHQSRLPRRAGRASWLRGIRGLG